MKTLILSLFIVSMGLTGSSKTWTISNTGTTFSPSSLAISQGDTVKFIIGSSHNVVEVSKENWDAGENFPLAGGFQLSMGGGTLLPEQLALGLHYYVCAPHVSLGMKGTITVLGPSGIPANPIESLSLYPNPANESISIKTYADLIGSPFSIVDVTGKEVITGKLENAEMKVIISNLANGIYFLQTNSQRRELLRFIKN